MHRMAVSTRLLTGRIPHVSWNASNILNGARPRRSQLGGRQPLLTTRFLSASPARVTDEADAEADQPERNDLWMEVFNDLKNHLEELRKERGMTEDEMAPVPTDVYLKNWINKQRYYYKHGRGLGKNGDTEERVKLLLALGVHIEANDQRWQAQFERIKKFKEEHGIFPHEIPYEQITDTDIRRLADWGRRQKRLYKAFKDGKPLAPQTGLSPERITKLEKIGWSWDRYQLRWENRYKQLVKYYKHHGNSLVPLNYATNPQLGKWVSEQRTKYRYMKEGKALALTEERLKLLQKVDFCFDAREAKWLEKYEEFAAFVKVNGPGVFPQKGSNPGLENWLRGQRKNYRLMMKGKSTGLTEKRKALLDKLGMQWET